LDLVTSKAEKNKIFQWAVYGEYTALDFSQNVFKFSTIESGCM